MLQQYEHSINRYRHRFLDEKLSALHLKNPDGILLVRMNEVKTIKMAQIIVEFPFHKSHVTRSVYRLFGMHLIKKTPDPDDLRGYILAITPKGEKTAAEVKKCLNEWTELVNKALSKEELATIAKLREKIFEHLKKYFEEDSTDEKNL